MYEIYLVSDNTSKGFNTELKGIQETQLHWFIGNQDQYTVLVFKEIWIIMFTLYYDIVHICTLQIHNQTNINSWRIGYFITVAYWVTWKLTSIFCFVYIINNTVIEKQ